MYLIIHEIRNKMFHLRRKVPTIVNTRYAYITVIIGIHMVQKTIGDQFLQKTISQSTFWSFFSRFSSQPTFFGHLPNLCSK